MRNSGFLGIVIFFLLNGFYLSAQKLITEAYDLLSGNEWAGGVKIYNDQYFFTGEGICDPEGDLRGCVYFTIAKINGELTRTLLFDYDIIDFSPKNEILIENDTVYLFGDDFREFPVLWKVILISQEGEILDTISFHPHHEKYVFAENFQIKDKYLYLAGRTWYSQPGEDLIFFKTDKQGNIILEERFESFADPTNTNILGDFEQSADGNFLITNFYKEKETKEFQVGICKFDKDFNILWSHYIPSRGDEIFNIEGNLTPTQDGGFVLSSGLNVIDSLLVNPDYYLNFGELPIVIYKFNISGNIQWTDTIFTKANSIDEGWGAPYQRVQKLITARNGDIIGIGTHEPVDSEPYKLGWIFRYSPDGKMKWQHYYGHSKYHGPSFFLDVVEAENEDIVCVGRISDETISNNYGHSWLLRLDSMGCYEPGCFTDTISKVTTQILDYEILHEKSYISVNPNPVVNNLNIQIDRSANWKRWRLLSTNGRLLEEGKVNGRDDFSIHGLIKFDPGIYFLQLLSDSGKVVTTKFVKI